MRVGGHLAHRGILRRTTDTSLYLFGDRRTQENTALGEIPEREIGRAYIPE